MKTFQVYFSILFFSLQLTQLTLSGKVVNSQSNDSQVSTEQSGGNKSEKEVDITNQISYYWCTEQLLPESTIDSVYNCFWKAIGDFGFMIQLKCENELFSPSSVSKNDVRKVMCKNEASVSAKLDNCYSKFSKKALDWMNRKFTSSRRRAKATRAPTATFAKINSQKDPGQGEMQDGWKKNVQLLVSNCFHFQLLPMLLVNQLQECMKHSLHIESETVAQ